MFGEAKTKKSKVPGPFLQNKRMLFDISGPLLVYFFFRYWFDILISLYGKFGKG